MAETCGGTIKIYHFADDAQLTAMHKYKYTYYNYK